MKGNGGMVPKRGGRGSPDRGAGGRRENIGEIVGEKESRRRDGERDALAPPSFLRESGS